MLRLAEAETIIGQQAGPLERLEGQVRYVLVDLLHRGGAAIDRLLHQILDQLHAFESVHLVVPPGRAYVKIFFSTLPYCCQKLPVL